MTQAIAEALKNKRPLALYMKIIRAIVGWYWLGTFGQIGTEALWKQKSKQSVKLIAWYLAHWAAKALGLGKQVFDCVGIDKYARWLEEDGTLDYIKNKGTDLNEAGLSDLNKELNLPRGPIATIPEQEGLIVTYTGHMGVYLGNGKVKEARGGAYGVVTTELKERGWTEWFVNPFIDYGGFNMLQRGSKDIYVFIWQSMLMIWNPQALPKHGTDQSFGGETETWTKAFQKAFRLPENGIVDNKVWQKMIDVIEADCGYKDDWEALKKSNADLQTTYTKAAAELATAKSTIKTQAEANQKLVNDLAAERAKPKVNVVSWKDSSIEDIIKELFARLTAKSE